MNQRPEWWSQANCAGTDPDLFYPQTQYDGGSSRRAAALYRDAAEVCAGCEVKDVCLEWGMEDLHYGMYGGLTPNERKRLHSVRLRQKAS